MSTPAAAPLPLADPTAMGLIGLAVGCAALTPIALGLDLSPEALKTCAVFCVFFGGFGQLLAGLGGFVNRNLFGATLFATFSFNWFMNGWMLWSVAGGVIPSHAVLLSVDICFLAIFLVMTYGFGFFSKLLFAFLLDIDLMYACKIVNGITGTQVLALPVALFTVALALIALWIAFALLINPTAGRMIFHFPGPLFKPQA